MADIDIIATLRDAITSGQTYTQISTAVPLNQPLAPGVTILLGYASGTTQTLTVSASASAGSSLIAVNSFMASATFVPGTLIGNSGAAVLGAVTQGSPPWVVSLPTGASTAAKQPALGTAGAASADVLSVQGVASGTPLPVFAGSSAPAGTALNTYSAQITTNATTTPTAATAYISSIVIVAAVAGTTSTLTIQDKQGTPLKLVDGLTTVAITTTPTVVNFQTPVKMVGGIDIVTAGAVAATNNVWINYFQ